MPMSWPAFASRAITNRAVRPVMMPEPSSASAVAGNIVRVDAGRFAASATATATQNTRRARTGTPVSPITGAVHAMRPDAHQRDEERADFGRR